MAFFILSCFFELLLLRFFCLNVGLDAAAQDFIGLTAILIAFGVVFFITNILCNCNSGSIDVESEISVSHTSDAFAYNTGMLVVLVGKFPSCIGNVVTDTAVWTVL